MEDKLTIITVCYNAEKEIEETIQSIIYQTYSNIEYLIVDGLSKDRTVDIIKRYEGSKIRWISELDKGLYDAMNKGIKMATGDWICFMNAGDKFLDNKVVESVFSRNILVDTGVVYGDVVLDYTPYGLVLKRMNHLEGVQQALGLCHQATFTRTSLLKERQYDLSYRIFADINAFYIMWEKGIKFQYVPVTFALFEAFDGVSSTKFYQCFKESTRMRGINWCSSLSWRKGLCVMIVKILTKSFLLREMYKRNKYKRILSNYEPFIIEQE